MKGFPWIQFFPRDWIADTRSLTLAAKGAWIDILAALHNSPTRGELTLEVEAWARLMGASEGEAGRVLSELGNAAVAEIVTLGNGRVTVKNRRMVREEKAREKTRQRVQRHRAKPDVPDSNHIAEPAFTLESNGVETNRSQKPEARSHIIPSADAEKEVPKKEPKKRERNLVLDALVQCYCGTIEGVPAATWRFAQSALREITAVSPAVTPEEIARRWTNLRLRFDGECSPTALVKWWPQCERAPAAAAPVVPFETPANLRNQS